MSGIRRRDETGLKFIRCASNPIVQLYVGMISGWLIKLMGTKRAPSLREWPFIAGLQWHLRGLEFGMSEPGLRRDVLVSWLISQTVWAH